MAKVVTKVVDQLAELKWLLAILVEKPLDAQVVAEQVVADLAAEQKWLLAILVVKLQAAIVAAVVDQGSLVADCFRRFSPARRRAAAMQTHAIHVQHPAAPAILARAFRLQPLHLWLLQQHQHPWLIQVHT